MTWEIFSLSIYIGLISGIFIVWIFLERRLIMKKIKQRFWKIKKGDDKMKVSILWIWKDDGKCEIMGIFDDEKTVIGLCLDDAYSYQTFKFNELFPVETEPMQGIYPTLGKQWVGDEWIDWENPFK
jgi:hypothetical protein